MNHPAEHAVHLLHSNGHVSLNTTTSFAAQLLSHSAAETPPSALYLPDGQKVHTAPKVTAAGVPVMERGPPCTTYRPAEHAKQRQNPNGHSPLYCATWFEVHWRSQSDPDATPRVLNVPACAMQSMRQRFGRCARRVSGCEFSLTSDAQPPN